METNVAIVTGGSRGIGAATALQLAERGYGVAVNFVNDAESASEIVGEIEGRGGRAVALRADVANESDVVRLFADVDEQLGSVTALVNNAGVLMQQARLEDMDTERVRKVLETNVLGPFLCCREAVHRMSTKRGGPGGAIVNVSSVAARVGAPHEYIDYAASKGAVDTLTRGLALEVADEGIRVNSVRPGFIYTEMHALGGEPGRVDRLAPQIPLRRGGAPEEVAASICWLLSDESSYVTGAFIDVAGGR